MRLSNLKNPLNLFDSIESIWINWIYLTQLNLLNLFDTIESIWINWIILKWLNLFETIFKLIDYKSPNKNNNNFQTYRTVRVSLTVKNDGKMPKRQNSNQTIWLIFKQCVLSVRLIKGTKSYLWIAIWLFWRKNPKFCVLRWALLDKRGYAAKNCCCCYFDMTLL